MPVKKDLDAGLVDIKQTVGDTRRIADLNDEWCGSTLLNLNKLLTDLNKL